MNTISKSLSDLINVPKLTGKDCDMSDLVKICVVVLYNPEKDRLSDLKESVGNIITENKVCYTSKDAEILSLSPFAIVKTANADEKLVQHAIDRISSRFYNVVIGGSPNFFYPVWIVELV